MKQQNKLAQTIDKFTTLDLTGVGLIEGLFQALQSRQSGPMCFSAAELISRTLEGGNGPVVIATGFPEPGGFPETDGPVGAAMLARALFMAFGVISVIVTDEDWFECVQGTCRGAGMAPMRLPESGTVPEIPQLRPIFIKTVPKEWGAAHSISDDLLGKTKPTMTFAIERPGMNSKGVYHGMGGRVLDDMVADLDYLVRRGQQNGIPLVAFGDGGNELGTGVIAEDLPKLLPQARDCGCPCKGGIGSATAADCLVVASVSNWAVTGTIAALAAVEQNPAIFHDPEVEIRSIELCTACGGVDGLSMSPDPAVDGISAQEWQGLLRVFRATVYRGMGVIKDWRQLR